jgi:hypothetical protein
MQATPGNRKLRTTRPIPHPWSTAGRCTSSRPTTRTSPGSRAPFFEPASEVLYNYVHDYQTSQWADYADNGLYLDEQTAGYTVEHNVMRNAPTNVAQNQNGSDTVMDNSANPSMASSTVANAGLEPAYVGIKAMTLPRLTF